MVINFCFDNFIPGTSRPWPNLAKFDRNAMEISPLGKITIHNTWDTQPPWVTDPMLLPYMDMCQVPYRTWNIKDAPIGSFYLVDLVMFDFQGTNYLDYMSDAALDRLRRREIKVIFSYGEADHMANMQDRIYEMCGQHNVNPIDIYVTMGTVTTAHTPANFFHFNEDFFSYQHAQRRHGQQPLSWHGNPRDRIMTVLNRVHKDWRAYFSAWFWQRGYDQQSYFSYNLVNYDDSMMSEEDISILDHMVDNQPGWRELARQFLMQCPFHADEMTDQDRNRHYQLIDEHFSNSYWNMVLETRMDLADNFASVFITEKTWKPIANAQPFMILGNANSLRYLKSLGYRTFSEIGIDESYDELSDPADRFQAVCKRVDHIFNAPADVHVEIMENAREILLHNQTLFWNSAKIQMEFFIQQLLAGKHHKYYY
jgi:hypothetical protein